MIYVRVIIAFCLWFIYLGYWVDFFFFFKIFGFLVLIKVEWWWKMKRMAQSMRSTNPLIEEAMKANKDWNGFFGIGFF